MSTDNTEAAVAAHPPEALVVYAICPLDEIPSRRARAFQLARIDEDGSEKVYSIFVVRWGNQVFGYVNRCPHEGVNLDWERHQFLDQDGLRILCGKHGARFEIGTGRCVDGPCQGRSLEPISVGVIDGDICVAGVTLAEDDSEDDEDEDAADESAGS